MSERLRSDVLVAALLRRSFDAGGHAAVLARGDAIGGAILILALDRGRDPVFYERGIGPAGRPALIRTGPNDSDEPAASNYWQRRRASDPDLWVIELDTARAQRLAAETLGLD